MAIPRKISARHEDIKFPHFKPGAAHIRASNFQHVPLALNPQTPVFMAGDNDSRTQRVKDITAFIRSHNFSLNEFLIAFYSSEDPSISVQRGCCLAKSASGWFAPKELIDLWFEHCPPNSRDCLERAVINQAGKIITRETDKACELEPLRVPTTKLGADDLDQDFLLAKLERLYTETLPLLWLLLFTVVTSWNMSEKSKKESAACKERKGIYVEFLCQLHSNVSAEVELCDRHAS